MCTKLLERKWSLSHVWLFATPWTLAYQVSPSMELFRQEYWNGLPFPSPQDLPNPGMEPRSPALQADALPPEPPGKHCSVAKSCPTLCNPINCNPPGSSVHRISQARVLEWVAISSSRLGSQPRDQTHISCVSCIGRQVLYYCATWQVYAFVYLNLSE